MMIRSDRIRGYYYFYYQHRTMYQLEMPYVRAHCFLSRLKALMNILLEKKIWVNREFHQDNAHHFTTTWIPSLEWFLKSFQYLWYQTSIPFSHSVVSDSLRPMNHSTPGLPVHYQLLEYTQTHVHWVSDAIQPSHPLSSPSLPALPFSSCPQSFPASGSFQMSQFFASGGQNIGVLASVSVLPMNTQDWSR